MAYAISTVIATPYSGECVVHAEAVSSGGYRCKCLQHMRITLLVVLSLYRRSIQLLPNDEDIRSDILIYGLL